MGTRRQFLQGVVGGLSAGLVGCRTTRAEADAGAQKLPTLVSSTVTVLRPSKYSSLEDAVKAVIAQAGGLSFIHEGQRVLIKPATNSSRRYPATSDPEVVMVVAKLVLEAGGVPFIADRTMFMRSTATTFRELGMHAAASEAKVLLQPLEDTRVKQLRHPLATHWSDSTIPIYEPVASADHVINLCTPRTHKLGDFTMALKNLVGVVDGGARMGMHFPGGFRERLAELSLVVPPSLVVMDGRAGFTNGGPDTGDLAQLDFLAASPDPLAIDAVGLGFLRLAGANETLMKGSIWALPVMKRAASLGVGASASARIHLAGLSPEDEAPLRAQLA
jgi:uncharacterized protein (DUF362 family)